MRRFADVSRVIRVCQRAILSIAILVTAGFAHASPGDCPEFARFALPGQQAPVLAPGEGGPLIQLRNGDASYVDEDSTGCMQLADATGDAHGLVSTVHFRPELISADLTFVRLAYFGSQEVAVASASAFNTVFLAIGNMLESPKPPPAVITEGDTYYCRSIAAPSAPQPTIDCRINSLSKDGDLVVASCGIEQCMLQIPMGQGLVLSASWLSSSPLLQERADQAARLSTQVHAFVARKIMRPE